jgi:hypothetical protein
LSLAIAILVGNFIFMQNYTDQCSLTEAELIAMDAIAWGKNRTVKHHTLVTGADFRNKDINPNGSVSITVQTDKPFNVKGSYDRLTFTAAEIDEMYRLSLAGSTKRLIQPLEAKPAETGGFVRRL